MHTFIVNSFIFITSFFNVIALSSLNCNTVSLHEVNVLPDRSYHDEVKEKIKPALEFCKAKEFNTDICMLSNMQRHSGEYRFYIYSFSMDSVLHTGLVAHGCGNELFAIKPVFSNVPGSNCTSLGRYKIGNSYYGNYGKAYKLYGLDSSNSNAFKRYIVLHSYAEMPHEETYPIPIMNSQGCPMLSERFIKTVSEYIDKSSKPIMLWIF